MLIQTFDKQFAETMQHTDFSTMFSMLTNAYVP